LPAVRMQKLFHSSIIPIFKSVLFQKENSIAERQRRK